MSKFAGLSDIRKQLDKESATQLRDYSATQNSEMPATQKISAATKKTVGRPAAKRSDPAYCQVSAYIRRATLKATKLKLLEDGREFSELLEDLLAAWVKARR